MAKVKVTLGSTYVGTDSEEVEFDVADREEFDSHEFSTIILNAITNRDFPHYYIDYEYIEDEEENDGE